jgi:hypothetical protein
MQVTALLYFCIASLGLVSATPVAAPNLIGNELQGIGIASQNSAVNSGDVSHNLGSLNTAQQLVDDDAQTIDTLKDVPILNVRRHDSRCADLINRIPPGCPRSRQRAQELPP